MDDGPPVSLTQAAAELLADLRDPPRRHGRVPTDDMAQGLALEKLEVAASRIPSGVNPNQASSYIIDPLKAQAVEGRRRSRWFSTHPSTEDRIDRLRGGSWRSGETLSGGPIS